MTWAQKFEASQAKHKEDISNFQSFRNFYTIHKVLGRSSPMYFASFTPIVKRVFILKYFWTLHPDGQEHMETYEFARRKWV